MNKENINRLKKYLFLISSFFVIVLWGHIWYTYFYHDAIETPIEWWSVSEWIIWNFPHLNPLLPSNDYNKNIIDKLYRSLVTYDSKQDKFIWDIANCDLQNLWYIECYLKENIKWSDGSDITTKDIISTFNVIKNSQINPTIRSLLEETTIEERDWAISFSNKVKDVNFINVLLQPIVSKEILDNSWNNEITWKFDTRNWIYSWKYIIENVSVDETLWIEKLILTKNEEYFDNDILIQKYIYKFFKDNNHFLKHKDTVNIFYDPNKIIWDSMFRLEKNSFYLNQYVWIFINQDRVANEDLRNFLLNKIDRQNIIKSLWSWYKDIFNPYLLEWDSIDKDLANSNIEAMMKNIWYYKKAELLNLASNDKEIKTSSWNTNTWVIQNKKENEDLKIITSPINKKYNFLWKDDILLKWLVNEWNVTWVYINDYKLSWYSNWDKEFYYRIKESYNNIKPWENKYKIEFEKNWKKELKEEFYIIYSKEPEKLKRLEEEYFKTQTSSWETNIPNKENTSNNSLNKEKINNLDEKYYYNKNLERYTLRFYYLDNQKEFYQIANIIKNNFDTYWIYAEIIPISIQELKNKISNDEKDYDMLLIWIELWYFNFNIFPYFHSSQVKWWVNFSNKKDLNLDIILEELKSNIFDKEKTQELEKKAISIIKEKQILKTLYSKENVILIDKNIKNFELNKNLKSTLEINQALNSAYVSADKQILFENKWIVDFFYFIKNIFENEWKSKG